MLSSILSFMKTPESLNRKAGITIWKTLIQTLPTRVLSIMKWRAPFQILTANGIIWLTNSFLQTPPIALNQVGIPQRSIPWPMRTFLIFTGNIITPQTHTFFFMEMEILPLNWPLSIKNISPNIPSPIRLLIYPCRLLLMRQNPPVDIILQQRVLSWKGTPISPSRL